MHQFEAVHQSSIWASHTCWERAEVGAVCALHEENNERLTEGDQTVTLLIRGQRTRLCFFTESHRITEC